MMNCALPFPKLQSAAEFVTTETMISPGSMCTALLQFTAEFRVELFFHLLASFSAGHAHIHQIPRACDSEAGVFRDETGLRVPLINLVAITFRHVEGGKHGTVCSVERLLISFSLRPSTASNRTKGILEVLRSIGLLYRVDKLLTGGILGLLFEYRGVDGHAAVYHRVGFFWFAHPHSPSVNRYSFLPLEYAAASACISCDVSIPATVLMGIFMSFARNPWAKS